jgi:tetratricopeptide (TPR) repeat protein
MDQAVRSPVLSRRWVVSPAWDLAYLVLTPLAIVPAVLLLAQRWMTAEGIYLAVISFASLGHHLPGFMRAYGDRDLFLRFRRRFLLAPPLALALALLFSPPRRLAEAIGLPWTHLHGLELILLVWGTWHGLMQTYGFMRIYDLRRGDDDRRTARLDHALCVAMFVAGVVFSDTRMFGVATAMWQTGLPIMSSETLLQLRWAVGVAGLAIAAAYACNLWRRRRQGAPVNGVKLLLAATTGWFYWYCGRLSTNLLIGIAMFEIYHAVQYNAIVWIYNRRLLERAGDRFGPLAFLFRDRTAMLCVYLAAIAAYSSARYFTAATGDRMFSGDLHNAGQWLLALFVASSLLHFYYDGFIWKVSQRKTRANLLDSPDEGPEDRQAVRGAAHAGKWLVLLAIAATLASAEQRYRTGGPDEETAAAALARLTPSVPEARRLASGNATRRAAELIETGHADQAVEVLAAARDAEPGDAALQLALGAALSAAGRDAEAALELKRAIDLDSRSAEARYQLGLAQLKQGNAQQAAGSFRRAVQLDPSHFQAQLQLADALVALGEYAGAADCYRQAVAMRPDSPDARIGLADAQLKAGDADGAEATLREGLTRNPEARELWFTLGLLLEHTGRAAEARQWLDKAAASGLQSPRGAQ